jgi:hypothetical protein
MSNLSIITPIIVAFIGIIGTITPYLIDKIFPQNDTPIIDHQIFPKPFENSISINLTNHGKEPATNMSLFIDASPSIILSLSNIFSTSDIYFNNTLLDIGEILPINNTITKIKIPVFIQGGGSFISLKITFKEPLLNSNFRMSLISIYNQGSIKTDIDSLTASNSKQNQFVNIIENYWYFYILFYPILLMIILRYYNKRKKGKAFFKGFIYNVLIIREILNLDIKTHAIFRNPWNIAKIEYLDESNNKLNLEIINLELFQKFLDIKDYLLLSKCFTIFKKRNLLLKNSKNNKLTTEERDLELLNKKLLRSINEILKKINWKGLL